MATEKRLIDANALMDAFRSHMVESYDRNKCTLEENCKTCEPGCLWRKKVSAAPTVDAVEVPCKMGDEVWGLKIYRNRQIPKKGAVYQMYFGDDMRLCISVKNVCRGVWGKNVFATEAEAQAAIGERSDDNG